MPYLVKSHYIDGLTKAIIDGNILGTDREIANACNQRPMKRGAVKAVEPADIAQVLVDRDLWKKLMDTADDLTKPQGRAARALTSIVTSPHVRTLNPESGELRTLVTTLRANNIISADDVTALRDACMEWAAGPSIGEELGIGEIFPEFVWQVKNPGKPLPNAARFEGPGAAAITDATGQAITDAEPANAATEFSAEIDLGANTLVPGVQLFATVAGFAAAPTGYVAFGVLPYYATGGTAFDSQIAWVPFSVSADAQYDFTCFIDGFSARYIKIACYNASGQNVDADGLDVWYRVQKITV